MELRSRKTLGKPLSATGEKGEELRMPLPEELVEKILAMVPFPQIFKSRALSKSWQARLSSISSQDDEEKKLLAMSFQKLVCDWSYKWKTYCPVYLFDDFLYAYDTASQHWLKVPTLSGFPHRDAMNVKACTPIERMFFSTMVGALLFITSMHRDTTFVVNIFTGSWKELPALLHMGGLFCSRKRLVCSKEMYKVITLYTNVGWACASIYDSHLGAWRSKKAEVPEILADSKVGMFDVYLNGVLYVAIYVKQTLQGFLTFDVKNETLNLLQMPPTDIIIPKHLGSHRLVACNGTVYIVVQEDPRRLTLLEADLVSRRWSNVIRGPPAALNFGFIDPRPSSDGDCLFFEGRGTADIHARNGKILAYNVRKDEWTYFFVNRILWQCLGLFYPRTFQTTFGPGGNPFLEA